MTTHTSAMETYLEARDRAEKEYRSRTRGPAYFAFCAARDEYHRNVDDAYEDYRKALACANEAFTKDTKAELAAFLGEDTPKHPQPGGIAYRTVGSHYGPVPRGNP